MITCVKLATYHEGRGHGWGLHAASQVLRGLQAAETRCASLWFCPVGCNVGFLDSVETGGKMVVFVRLEGASRQMTWFSWSREEVLVGGALQLVDPVMLHDVAHAG